MNIFKKQEKQRRIQEHYKSAEEYMKGAQHYIKRKNYDKAEASFLNAVEIYKQQISVEENENIRVCLADTYGKLALMFDENRNIDKAKKYYSKAMGIMEECVSENKLEYVSGLVAGLNCLGVLIESENCFRKAYTYAKLLPEDAVCKDVIETWGDVFK